MEDYGCQVVSGPQTTFQLARVCGVNFCDLIINHPPESGVTSAFASLYTHTRPGKRSVDQRLDAKCPLCDNPWPTVQHILNGCSVSLSQGRYTWRHDSALKILANGLRECLQPGERLFILSPSFSLNFALCMHAHCRFNNIILFHYIILHNDYHNMSWYNV